MKFSKIIAIIGAIVLILAFFLPWGAGSVGDVKLGNTGLGIATGRPQGMGATGLGFSDYNTSNYEAFIKSTLEEYFGAGAGMYSGIFSSINKIFSDWTLFLFPVFGVVVILLSLLSFSSTSKSYGIVIVLMTIGLGLFLGSKIKTYSVLANIDRLAGSIGSLLGLGDIMPKYRMGIGVYATIAALIVILIAGIMAWFSNEKETGVQRSTSYQQGFAPGYPNQPYPQHPQQWQAPQQPQQPQQWQYDQQPQQWQPPQQPQQWQAPQQPQQPQQWQPPQQPPQWQPPQQPPQWQPPQQPPSDANQGPLQGWRKNPPPEN